MFLLFLLVALNSGGLLRAQPAPPAGEPFVARNTGEFWNPPPGQRDQPQRIDLVLNVYYYDPQWHLLWGAASDVESWFDTAGKPLPIRSGQRVRIVGTYVPSVGITGDAVQVSVLADRVWPAPLESNGDLENWQRFDARFVSVEGYVCRQYEVDPTHVEYDLLSQGRVIVAHVQLDATAPVPQLVGARIKMECVYVSRRDQAGQLQGIAGWIPEVGNLHVLGRLDQDLRLNLPVTPIDQLSATPRSEWVHIRGELRPGERGHAIVVRDATGQVVIRTEQPVNAVPGEFVDVIGRPAGRALTATLLDPVCRVRSAAADVAVSESGPMLKLRLVDQLMELRPEDAARHYPATLRGVVTWSDPRANFFFLQDGSGGIRVHLPQPSAAPPTVGSMLTLHGNSLEGVFAPELELRSLDLVSPDSAFAAATEVTLDQAMSGALQGERVDMRGFVRAVERKSPWLQLDLTTASGEFTALLPPETPTADLIGAIVRVTGVCTAVSNAQRQLTGVQLWGGANAAQIVEARLADRFSAPVQSIRSLRQFRGFRALDRQIRINGVVTYNRPGRVLYLQQQDAGLLVLHRDSAPVAPGDSVEIVGLPGRDGNRLVLREATWRPTGGRQTPVPLEIRPGALDDEADGRLVRIRGRLQDKFTAADGHRLIMREGDARFEAWLDLQPSAALPDDGSVLELTGVYVLEYDEYRRPRSARLQLRDATDIRVVAAPSWWTARRALAIAGGFAACALLGIAWVVVLRRRVAKQTAQIRAQVEKQARLDTELERAARLESLGVLAGGIAHDFNNLLTVIIANLGLAAMDDRVQQAAGKILADAERGALRAAELTQQLLTFAKGGDPVRRAVSLPDVVRESAEFARHGSRVRCTFEVEPDLPPAEVDRGQISRVVHNLVLNATQAMPEGGVVRITLAAVTVGEGEHPNLKSGRYVRLSVADEGRGIAPEHLKRVFEPYFSTKPKNNGLGLATVHSIIRKHQGHIRVRSELGHGTTFDIWLPVATTTPATAPAGCAAPCATTSLRVLFMDDDDTIRATAATILRQLGHEAKIVPDGMDVVREYEAALNSGRRYDVVVLDLTVPGGLGGRAAMEILRRVDPTVRGIVSSGYSNDPVLANFRAYGFSAVVPKPYVIDDLARAIQQVAAAGTAAEPQAVGGARG